MLSIINKSILLQQESVTTLAKSMGKRFKTLDAKLNCIQMQKNIEEVNNGQQANGGGISSRRTSEIRSEQFGQGQPSYG
jgi:hypothetical protein